MPSSAFAHPADELCFEDAMDISLCSQLAELDRINAAPSALPSIELDRSAFETFSLYTQFGIEHILPFGIDHLAFLLALVLAAKGLRSLIIQISVFTLAHSLTLILGVLGLVTLNASLVEAIIALSIAFVAVENLFFKYKLGWRSLIIFGFGLLHGLGFAGALGDLGIPTNHYVSALLGFNLGVEIAQILFGLICFLILHKAIKPFIFRRFVYLPLNCFVAALGIYWLAERTLL
ncbi:MAG: HupE/UreJ family protein [Gammaproteobacteria bacterium]|nr:HupE/UreJ family protein [Gammaproteobacteria bacterium]